MIGRCCCAGTPCTGDNCCTACDGENCCVVADQYVVNIGTAYCDCWTWGEYTVDAPGWRYCPTEADPCNQSDDCEPQVLLVKGQCEAGEFEQHNAWRCEISGDCPTTNRGDDTWHWPKGMITAAFPMDLAANPIDPSGQCCTALPSETATVTFTSFTGAPNAAALNAVVCYPFPGAAPDGAAAVTVSAGFCACRDHPCIEWSPTEFVTEAMCSPCSGKWDVLTVLYVVRNEHEVKQYYCFTGGAPGTSCCDPPQFGCWTWDEWTALVRYVRKPVCTESGEREIVGTYTFACAELYLPRTSLFIQPGGAFGTIGELAGQGRRLEYVNQTPPGTCGNPLSFCTWAFPYEPICPGDFFPSGSMAKICAPATSGYGWSFPPTVTITYAP